MTNLDDIRILIGEALFDEAERRLMEILNLNPRDLEAVSLLSEVERQIYLQRNLQMRIPTRSEAVDELERLVSEEEYNSAELGASVFAWLDQSNPIYWIDCVIVLGVSGFLNFAETWIEQKLSQQIQIPHLNQIEAWLGRFYFDQNKFSKARQWFERAIPLVMDRTCTENVELWKQLRLFQLQCIWQMGDRHQAIQCAMGMKTEFPNDLDVKRIITMIEREA